MWAPGFVYKEYHPALLHGWHRDFTIISREAWGSADKPGLVVALHPGGSCRGYAFRVAAAHWQRSEAYLQDRERAYRHLVLPVKLAQEKIPALTFVTDPGHPRTTRDLDLPTMAKMISEGVGNRGTSYEYFCNILSELRKMNCKTPEKMHKINALIEKMRM